MFFQHKYYDINIPFPGNISVSSSAIFVTVYFPVFSFAETVCQARIPVDSRDEKGFDILLHLNLAKKAKKTQGTFSGTKAYEVTPRVDLSEATR